MNKIMSNRININNIYRSLTLAEVDPAVGIRIASLAGDKTFGLYCAELSPHKSVSAHYHRHGIEIYHIIEGNGVIHTGKPYDDDSIMWNEPVTVETGDAFTIQAGEVHQLFNTLQERLIVLFGCSSSHLGKDRIVVKGYHEKK